MYNQKNEINEEKPKKEIMNIHILTISSFVGIEQPRESPLLNGGAPMHFQYTPSP